MMLSVVIFSCLALLPLPEVLGQTFCTGGILPCVSNAVCNPDTDQCECATGFTGNGRVACRGPNRCTCTALADPNFGLFDSQASPQKVKANLPCSVTMVDTFFNPPSCVITSIVAHPETRGSGTASNLRVFVKELEVMLALPSVAFILDSSGTSVTMGASEVVSAVNSDQFQTATVANCASLQVGYNGTYGGAFVDSVNGTYTTPGLCGNCDNIANENIGASNDTNLAYFLKFLSPTANQKGTYAASCGLIQAAVSGCTDARLNQAANVCGRYLSDFGVCLVDDPAAPVPDFDTLLSSRFLPCVTDICSTGSTVSQCNTLTTSETTLCKVGATPTSC